MSGVYEARAIQQSFEGTGHPTVAEFYIATSIT